MPADDTDDSGILSQDEKVDRRQFIEALGAAGIAGVAGCMGGDGGQETDNTQGNSSTQPPQQNTQQPTVTETNPLGDMRNSVLARRKYSTNHVILDISEMLEKKEDSREGLEKVFQGLGLSEFTSPEDTDYVTVNREFSSGILSVYMEGDISEEDVTDGMSGGSIAGMEFYGNGGEFIWGTDGDRLIGLDTARDYVEGVKFGIEEAGKYFINPEASEQENLFEEYPVMDKLEEKATGEVAVFNHPRSGSNSIVRMEYNEKLDKVVETVYEANEDGEVVEAGESRLDGYRLPDESSSERIFAV